MAKIVSCSTTDKLTNSYSDSRRRVLQEAVEIAVVGITGFGIMVCKHETLHWHQI